MKHIKFTYVDSVTGVSVAKSPAVNGPDFPAIAGLQFIWARESQYPTSVPDFFGTCDADADLSVDGFLGEFLQADWEQMRADEMRARNPVPQSVTMRQARLALLQAGLLAQVGAAIDQLPEPDRTAARIEWEYSQEVQRDKPFVQMLAPALGLDQAQLDALFIHAATL